MTLSWGQTNLPHWMSTGVKGMSCTLSHYNTVHAGVMVYVCEDFMLIRSNRSTSQNPLMLTPGYQNVYRYQTMHCSLSATEQCLCLSLPPTPTHNLFTLPHLHQQGLHTREVGPIAPLKKVTMASFSSFFVLHGWSRQPITFSNSRVVMTNSLS